MSTHGWGVEKYLSVARTVRKPKLAESHDLLRSKYSQLAELSKGLGELWLMVLSTLSAKAAVLDMPVPGGDSAR